MTAFVNKQVSEVNKLASGLSFDFYYGLLSACSTGNLTVFDLPIKEFNEFVVHLEQQDVN